YDIGKYEMAEKSCRQVLDIINEISVKEEIQETDLSKANVLNGLAKIYARQGKYEEAKEYFNQSFEIWNLLPDPRPDGAQSWNDLGRFYYSQGKYKEAEALYHKALNIRSGSLGLQHPDTGTSLNDLASLYYRLGKYKEAEPLYQQALSIWTVVL